MDLIPPNIIDEATTETRDSMMDDRVMQLWNSVPEPWRDFILALLAADETGTMPMPPGMDMPMPAAPLTPPTLM